MEQVQQFLDLLASNLSELDNRTRAYELIGVITRISNRQDLSEKPTSPRNQPLQSIASSPEDPLFGDVASSSGIITRSRSGYVPLQRVVPQSGNIGGPLFESLYPKRRRLNNGEENRPAAKASFKDINDDCLGIIMLCMISGKQPEILRPRQLKTLYEISSFAGMWSRAQRIYNTYICAKIHTLDAVYPLNIQEGVRLTPRHLRPETIAYLSKVAGKSLRVVRIPSHRAVGVPNDDYQNCMLHRTRYMMKTIAKACSQLRELAVQDHGSLDNGIAKLLVSRNPGLKHIQVDVPGSDFISALAESECTVEVLILLRVQDKTLSALKKFLSKRGGSLRRLEITLCGPLDPDYEPSNVDRLLRGRREKSFTEALAVLVRTKMTSLQTLSLQPDKRAAWFRNFITRFQMLKQADLIIGESALLYPAATEGMTEPPRPKFNELSIDRLWTSRSPMQFDEYVSSLNEPDTLSIMKPEFPYAYSLDRDDDDEHDELEQNLKDIIREKGRHVRRLVLALPLPHIDMFEALIRTISDILNTIEEEFHSLDQIEEVQIPIQVITYLASGVGYEKLIARLRNLKVLRFVKNNRVIDKSVTLEVPQALPTFLRGIMNACPELQCICISDADITMMCPPLSNSELVRALEDAMIALNEYEAATVNVDIWTVRRQLAVWVGPLVPYLQRLGVA